MSNLPTGWQEIPLNEISEIVMGQSPPSSSYNSEGRGLPFFQGKAEFQALYPRVVKFCDEPKKIAETGDILLSVRAPVGPTNLNKEKSCIGRGLAAIRPSQVTSSQYLLNYLRFIEPILSKQGTGSTFTAISKKDVEGIAVLLAPLDEQQRIVAKLDQLLAKVDACKERLDKIPAILKRFRQSVLSAACSGRLTEEWRAPHDVGDRDWKIVAFFDFCLLQRGYDLPLSNSVNGPYPIVTSAGEVAYHNQFKAHGPGVVTGRSGSIGKVYYVDKDFWPHNTALFVRDFRGNYPRYVYYFLLGFDTRQFSASTAVPTLNRNNLRDLEVNVPPIDEQHEIVRRVEALFKLADDIEKRYEKARAHVDRLTQSILAKAFRGELVPQDPGDEPASELLKRIRQEKASKEEKGGVRSRRTRQD